MYIAGRQQQRVVSVDKNRMYRSVHMCLSQISAALTDRQTKPPMLEALACITPQSRKAMLTAQLLAEPEGPSLRSKVKTPDMHMPTGGIGHVHAQPGYCSALSWDLYDRPQAVQRDRKRCRLRAAQLPWQSRTTGCRVWQHQKLSEVELVHSFKGHWLLQPALPAPLLQTCAATVAAPCCSCCPQPSALRWCCLSVCRCSSCQCCWRCWWGRALQSQCSYSCQCRPRCC